MESSPPRQWRLKGNPHFSIGLYLVHVRGEECGSYWPATQAFVFHNPIDDWLAENVPKSPRVPLIKMVPGPTSILRVCDESPQALAKMEKPLSRTSIPTTLVHVPELHKDVAEATMPNTMITAKRSPLTEFSEFSLSKELVKLLPENFQPKSNHEFRWQSTQPFKIFTYGNLPLYETTSMAIEGLFQIQSAALHLYFVDENEAREMLETVYAGNASSPLTLCELFAVAAVGSQWEERVPSEIVHGYFNTVRAHLDDCLEEDDLRGMRILGLCSMFLMSEKRISSWSYIGNALQIGHSRGLQSSQRPENIPHNSWIGLRRLWRTLIFFESWLAASLGRIPVYSPEYNNADLSESERTLDGQGPSRCNEFQLELVKIGFLNANILKNVFAPSTVSLPVVRECMLKLEDWFDNLPDSMRLTSMLASDVSTGERTTVFTIHIMYLATIILLTRRVMIEIMRGEGNSLDGPLRDSIPYANACISAAKQIAGILGLLYAEYGGGLFKKCWLAICSSFNASVILLFFAAQKKMLGQPHANYQNDLIDASKCITAIEACAEKDALSRCYLTILAPFREAVGGGGKDYGFIGRVKSSPSQRYFTPKLNDPTPWFHGSDQSGVFEAPLPPGSSDIITNDLLDIIRKPHIYNRDYGNNPAPPGHSSYYTDNSGGSHLGSWTPDDHSRSSLSFGTIDTPRMCEIDTSSKKRGRDLDLGRDKGWAYSKRLRYSPKSLEAFLRRVA